MQLGELASQLVGLGLGLPQALLQAGWRWFPQPAVAGLVIVRVMTRIGGRGCGRWPVSRDSPCAALARDQ